MDPELNTEIDDEEAAMAAGFKAVQTGQAAASPEEPAPAAAPAPAPAEAPAPAPAAEAPAEPPPVEDPFASLPQQVRDLLATIPTMQQRVEAAEARARESVGRVASFQSQLDKLRTTPPAAPAPEPAKRSRAAVDAIRKDLPEIAAAFDELEELAAQAKPPAAPAPEPASAPASPAAAPASDPQSEALDELRPTWAEEASSSDFQLWLATQPRDYQLQIASTNKAKDLLSALTKFDGYRQQLQTTRAASEARQTRIAAAVVPQGDGRRLPSNAPAVDEEEAAMAAGFKKVRGR